MAMLAAPRSKQKVINLRAKNSAWSNDSNKFGQRMLEKMGWSSGKGLGAKENGIVEHVVARYKNDDKGLGYEDKNDQWTKHEDDFNSLLANLANSNDNDEKLISGESLEVKSKKSKTRVHYHKFTRGKDLSRYSEKDLANIFGKKSFKNEKPTDKPAKADVKVTEQVFTEKGSMEDYFKSKLAALKGNKTFLMDNNAGDEYEDHSFQGFSQVDSKGDSSEIDYQSLSFNSETTNNEIDEPRRKKKKKSKKHDEVCVSTESNENEPINSELELNSIVCEDIQPKMSKKKHKLKETECTTDIQETISKKKKSKKNKLETYDEIQTQQEDEDLLPRKKKKKNK